jgi:serine/threonine-protein kinase
MWVPSEIIRAARLAVSNYGADPSRVQEVVQAVLAAQARGEGSDLFAALVREDILTPRQAAELRTGLDKTQVDHRPGVALKPEPAPPRATSPDGQELPELLRDLHVLGGYRVLRRLGAGGMGAVFLAFDPQAGRQVALKVLAPEFAAVEGLLDRFRREGTSGRSLNHPNVVRNIGSGQDSSTKLHFLVLEFVDGPSAHDLLERFGRLKVGDAVHIILDVARALAHAHSSAIVHRDIKPANILLTSAGVAKLSDLGLAKRTDETSHLTHARQGVGTPYYMPYEQALNAKAVDVRSDIFALGATLYHLLTGEVPFPGENPIDVMEKKEAGVFLPARCFNPDVPEALDRILARMLARRPENRYPGATELIADLERTGLDVPVPSFVDLDLALRDPVVRQRLTTAAQPTSVDVNAAPADGGKVAPATGFWYLRFKDRHGRLCKAKLTQAQVLRRLREGKLSPRVEAARSPNGAFRPLASYADFREAGAPPRPAAPAPPVPAPTHWRDALLRRLARVPWWWVLAAGLGVGILGMILFTAWHLAR